MTGECVLTCSRFYYSTTHSTVDELIYLLDY